MPFLTSTYRLFRRFFAPSARGLHQLKDKIGVYIQLKALLWRYELLKGGYNIASALLLLALFGRMCRFCFVFLWDWAGYVLESLLRERISGLFGGRRRVYSDGCGGIFLFAECFSQKMVSKESQCSFGERKNSKNPSKIERNVT